MREEEDGLINERRGWVGGQEKKRQEIEAEEKNEEIDKKDEHSFSTQINLHAP